MYSHYLVTTSGKSGMQIRPNPHLLSETEVPKGFKVSQVEARFQ